MGEPREPVDDGRRDRWAAGAERHAREGEEVDLVEAAGDLLRLGTRDDRLAEPDLDDAPVVRDPYSAASCARLRLRHHGDLL